MFSKKVKAKHFAIIPGGVETHESRFREDGNSASGLAFCEDHPMRSLEQLLSQRPTLLGSFLNYLIGTSAYTLESAMVDLAVSNPECGLNT
jgi:hypothetical protein